MPHSSILQLQKVRPVSFGFNGNSTIHHCYLTTKKLVMNPIDLGQTVINTGFHRKGICKESSNIPKFFNAE